MKITENHHVRRISVSLSCFAPDFIMEINVPNVRDDEEYIDEFLDGFIKEDLCFNCEWEFAD